MAEVPDRILNDMYNRQYNSHGAFRFYFWVNGDWVGVNIDDRLPSVHQYGKVYRPWATHPSALGAWWMPLLEKAYAKLNMNYDRISAGNGIEGLRALTGKPVSKWR